MKFKHQDPTSRKSSARSRSGPMASRTAEIPSTMALIAAGVARGSNAAAGVELDRRHALGDLRGRQFGQFLGGFAADQAVDAHPMNSSAPRLNHSSPLPGPSVS